MKKIVLLISTMLLAMFVIVGCHKDPIDFGHVGLLRLELKKGYTTQNKGAVESFYAKVTIVYDKDEVVYNCLFSDPNNTGFYTNDLSDGDKIFVRKDVEFHIIIETEIDGYVVTGESASMMYSDDMDMLSVEIVLKAGSTRIAIYMPREDEIYGNYVVAYGEILENVSQYPIREAGVMLVPKSVYNTYESPDAFSFENENNSSSYIVEYYYAEQDEQLETEITKFSVVLRGLEPNTHYCMRAFTFSESDTAMSYCYSRVVEFSTNNNVARDISVVTNEADNVTIESVDIAGRVVLLDGNSADSVMEMGFIFDTYENYVANSNNLDYYRNNSFTYPASEITNRDDIIVFTSTVSGLQEGVTYVFRAYATFRDQPYYGAVRLIAVPQDPANIVIRADEIASTQTASYVDLQGSIINDAGYEFSELGFVYKFYDRGETPSSVYDLTETSTASVMSGRFSSRVNLPIVTKTMYYAAYAVTTTGYQVFGEMSQAISITPENVPEINSLELDESGKTTHSLVVSCNVVSNGRSDCECGIVYVPTQNLSDTSAYLIVRKVASSDGIEEFVLNNLQPSTEYTFWAYIKVVDETIETQSSVATTLGLGDTGPGGGKIFYVSSDGFALEYYYTFDDDPEAGADSASMVVWGSTAGLALNADAPNTISISGRTNTEAIVSYHNSIGFNSEYAALKCYQSTQNGKNDWYLPTAAETEALLNYISENQSQDLMIESTFWTSDEYNATTAVAYVLSPNMGVERQNLSKDNVCNYIMVRRF